ncbi:hypothetical protein C8R47DRAFT_1250858, partial [Mycena vitilis]
LIKYLDLYLEFLDVIEYTKATISLTNIEVNLRRALKDTPTLVELCAMVLYSQIISHPYLRVVRGPGTSQTNLLDLGPLHIEVRAHIERLLEDPELLFGSDMSFATAAMDAQPWEDPKAVDAAVKLLATLPDHREIVLAFFRGALATWIRFSVELAPGGLIDRASAEERLAAWMPSTNDANEGTLGVYRVTIRGHPTLTLHQFNAMQMYRTNDTQAFMDAIFTRDDDLYIMRKAREIDASGLEKQRKQELADFRVRLASMKKAQQKAAKEKAAKELHELLKVPFISCVADIYSPQWKLTIPRLHQQLQLLRLRRVIFFPTANTLTRLRSRRGWRMHSRGSSKTPR